MLKKLVVVFYVLVFIFSAGAAYAQVANSGFVSGNIWYSKDSFQEGDKIKIYTFIFNPNDRELRGTASFYDKDTVLGKKDFRIASQSADDVSIDWTVSVGSHSIYAKIENPKILNSKGALEDAELKDTQTKSSVYTIKKKVDTKDDKSETSTSESGQESATSLKSIQNKIEENTPTFISSPIISLTSSLENSRIAMQAVGEEKKVSMREDLDRLKSSDETKENNIFLKPFKYVELFALTIFNFIVSTHIFFYIALILIIFLVFRWVWMRFL